MSSEELEDLLQTEDNIKMKNHVMSSMVHNKEICKMIDFTGK